MMRLYQTGFVFLILSGYALGGPIRTPVNVEPNILSSSINEVDTLRPQTDDVVLTENSELLNLPLQVPAMLKQKRSDDHSSNPVQDDSSSAQEDQNHAQQARANGQSDSQRPSNDSSARGYSNGITSEKYGLDDSELDSEALTCVVYSKQLVPTLGDDPVPKELDVYSKMNDTVSTTDLFQMMQLVPKKGGPSAFDAAQLNMTCTGFKKGKTLNLRFSLSIE